MTSGKEYYKVRLCLLGCCSIRSHAGLRFGHDDIICNSDVKALLYEFSSGSNKVKIDSRAEVKGIATHNDLA